MTKEELLKPIRTTKSTSSQHCVDHPYLLTLRTVATRSRWASLKKEKMPIPNEVIFGPGFNTERISYGEVRELSDNVSKLKILKKRLDKFLIEQIDPLSERDINGNLKIWSPFPLTYLTCSACETLGRLVIDKTKIKNDDVSREASIYIFGKIDNKFTRKPQKGFHEQMKEIWSNEEVKKMKNYSEIFYKYLRNSFAHGYRAKNIFLNHELTVSPNLIPSMRVA